jgi:transcriptional regulator GlxA family with amidase domain
MKFTTLFLVVLSTQLSSPIFATGPCNVTDVYVCPPCFDGSCDTQEYDKPGQCPACGMTLIKKSNIKNVAIFIFNGVELLDFSGPGEVFAAADVPDGAFNVYTVAMSTDPIVSQGFLSVTPDYNLENAPDPDIIVLPGGNVGPSVNNPDVINWIKSHSANLDALMSVCNGAHILQKTGLLDGKKATTHHGAIANLRANSPTTQVLENTRWVDNGQIITTAGVSAGIDGALRIIERMYGFDAAQSTARYMEYDKWDPKDGVIVK